MVIYMEKGKKKRGNERLAKLVVRAAGDRSLRRYAKDAGVDPSIVTRIATEEYLPGISVLQRLASEQAAPCGGVTLADYMREAGYSSKVTTAANVVSTLGAGSAALFALSAGMLPFNAGAAATVAMTALNTLSNQKKSTLSEHNGNEELLNEYKERHEKFGKAVMGIIYAYMGENGIVFQLGSSTDVEKEPVVPDYNVKIINNDQCEEWWFLCWPPSPISDGNISMTKEQEAELLIMQLARTKPNRLKKVSIVVEDKEGFEALSKLKDLNSYKGNLTVIKVDMDAMKVDKENVVSTY